MKIDYRKMLFRLGLTFIGVLVVGSLFGEATAIMTAVIVGSGVILLT